LDLTVIVILTPIVIASVGTKRFGPRLPMFKKLLQKGKCLVGFHEGEWNYEQPAQCIQTRLCTLCQKRQERTHHIWAVGIEREGDCAQRGVCERCAERRSAPPHNWERRIR
jgi:hypothetical protein